MSRIRVPSPAPGPRRLNTRASEPRHGSQVVRQRPARPPRWCTARTRRHPRSPDGTRPAPGSGGQPRRRTAECSSRRRASRAAGPDLANHCADVRRRTVQPTQFRQWILGNRRNLRFKPFFYRLAHPCFPRDPISFGGPSEAGLQRFGNQQLHSFRFHRPAPELLNAATRSSRTACWRRSCPTKGRSQSICMCVYPASTTLAGLETAFRHSHLLPTANQERGGRIRRDPVTARPQDSCDSVLPSAGRRTRGASAPMIGSRSDQARTSLTTRP